ncbi:MAG: hypothetical protein ACLVB1_15900, partial [Blautia obeum]
SLIRTNQKVFAILGTSDGTAHLAQKLTDYGMGEVQLYVGENLSYEDEKIFVKQARELADYRGDALSVICAWNPDAKTALTTHGLPDDAFTRGKAPMTKTEVRTVSLAKLCLKEDSVCYDIGAEPVLYLWRWDFVQVREAYIPLRKKRMTCASRGK